MVAYDILVEINVHIKEHGYHILNEDNPFQRKIGFHCTKTDKRWAFSLTEAKCIVGKDEEETNFIKTAMATAEDRLNLVRILHNWKTLRILL